MRKIIIIGCPGSGKSTFAKRLHEITAIPLYHIDMIYWHEDKTHLTTSELACKLNDILCIEEWILDGNYISTMEMRLENCDTVFFLDFPVEICLEGIKSRIGIQRTDMPWVETQCDEELINYVERFNKEIRPAIINLLDKYDKNIIIFKSRKESYEYINDINKGYE